MSEGVSEKGEEDVRCSKEALSRGSVETSMNDCSVPCAKPPKCCIQLVRVLLLSVEANATAHDLQLYCFYIANTYQFH